MISMTQQDMAAWDAGTFDYMSRQADISTALDRLLITVHQMAGDKKAGFGGPWSYTHEQALNLIGGLGDEENPRYRTSAAQLLAQVEEARSIISELGDIIEVRERTWETCGRWSRYFPCLNADGHIHSSLRGCPTVRWETTMGWATQMSGLTADEAIHGVEGAFEGLGETLCSVCFPEAPAQWCRTRSQVTRAEREAAKAAKAEAKFAKNLRPGEAFRAHDGDRIETVAAAKIVVRSPAETAVELEWYRSEEARKGWDDQDRYAEFIARMERRLASETADARRANEILLAREAAAPGTGWTQADADRAVASAAKRTRKAYFG